MGGYAAQLTGWRTPLYILLGLSTFCLVVLFFLFPETSADTILLRRAQRLRKLTGNTLLKSKSEMDHAQLAFSEVLSTALLRPFILFFEPVVALLDIYTALVYAWVLQRGALHIVQEADVCLSKLGYFISGN